VRRGGAQGDPADLGRREALAAAVAVAAVAIAAVAVYHRGRGISD